MSLNIGEIFRIIRKHFAAIVAVSVLFGLLGGAVATLTQTYTCTLGFKYNHAEAVEGLAPDGSSKLDPYELKNPLLLHGALEKMGFTDDDLFILDDIRQSISINKVVSDLDKDVSESAALLGTKYEAATTEYEMSFTYKASLGDEFGPKVFSNLITEYDRFFLDKYYKPETIIDFAKVVRGSDAEYIVIADAMSSNIDKIIATLQDLSANYPNYRSVRTGYTFASLATMYQNLQDIEYAKYYGNIRAGNLARDREMVIKSYQAKIKDLTETMTVSSTIAENYRQEISTFYNSYKAAGLYRQAQNVQQNLDSSNTRDREVLEDYDVDKYLNTYDNIIISYSDNAGNATDASRTIDYYNTIIQSYENDTVPQSEKDVLLEKNEQIFDDLAVLSEHYSKIANETISELYNAKVNADLQYLIIPESTTDKPVVLITVFIAMLTFGLILVAIFLKETAIVFIGAFGDGKAEEEQEKKIEIDTTDMDEMHKLLYEQYLKDFDEMYLVYQKMVATNPDDIPHSEVFVRWESPTLGTVAPPKIIECLSDFGLFKQFNSWVIKSVCSDLAAMKDKKMTLPIVHINCPHTQIDDFALNDIIIEQLREKKIPAKHLCFELNGAGITDSLDDIVLLTEMGVNICIDNFEDSDEHQEILRVIKPGYVKLSHNALNSDIYATSESDTLETINVEKKYLSMVLLTCHTNNIKACICGIENNIQDKIVSEMGFDYKQGYYYGKPQRLEL